MITNPLFQPQNLRQQYSPGMPASLAYALMPTDNFAQKRADAAASIQYQAMAQGLAEQAAAEKEKALLDTQKSLALIDQQDILGPDMKRLNESLTENWRKGMEEEIKNQYGGDIVRWKRERQPYHVMMHERILKNSPEFQQALNTKTNYAQWQEARSKGKLTVGDMDKAWSDYVSGKTKTLDYRGSYDPPKEGFDYFDKTLHPTNPYGINGKPVGVSQNDLYAHLMSQGLSGEQAADYIGKIGYRENSRFWKMDSEKPWDAAKEQFNESMQNKRFGLAQSSEMWNRKMDMANLGIRQQEADNKKNGGAGVGTPTIVSEIFGDSGFSRVYTKAGDGQKILMKTGPRGKSGEALIRAAGINPTPTPGSEYAGEGNRKLLQSTLTKVYSTDISQEYNAKAVGDQPQTFQFESVNPGELLKYGKRRFITGVARINGTKKKVAIEVPDSEFTRGELTNTGDVYNNKNEKIQYNINEQTVPFRRTTSSKVPTLDDFYN